MPTHHAPSPLEAQRQQDRLSQRESRRRQREIHSLEPMVEKVIAHEAKARQEVEVVRQFDDPEFSANASEQRTEWFLVRAFFAILVVYVLAEALVMGDLAEGLASAFHPLFAEGEELSIPLWLRRVAAIVFVFLMTAATLGLKISCARYRSRLQSRRVNLNPGEELTEAALRSGLWTVFGVKIAYLGFIVLVYSWLYGLSHDRALSYHEAKVTSASAEQDSWEFNFGDGLSNEADDESVDPAFDPEVGDRVVTQMARGAQIFYLFMVVLHAAILGFPVGNPVEHRPLAGLNKEKSEKVSRLEIGKADVVARAIYNRIRTAPEAYRQDLIELCTPIHESINRAMGTIVFEPPREQTVPPPQSTATPAPATWPDSYADVFGGPPTHA